MNRFSSEEDLEEALTSCKYLLSLSVSQAYSQIVRDITLFKGYFSTLDGLISTAVYTTNAFNVTVDFSIFDFALSNLEYGSKIAKPSFANDSLELDTDISKKYFAYELSNLHNKLNIAKSNSFLNENDLNLLVEQVRMHRINKNKVHIDSKFVGEGGVLKTSIHFRPLRNLITFICLGVLLFLLVVIALSSIIFLTTIEKEFGILCAEIGVIALICYTNFYRFKRTIFNTFKEIKWHARQ